MADAKISALADGTTPSGTDKFVVARAGANDSLTWTEMLAAMPGHEISYTELTSFVNLASSTEASGTSIFTPGAITFDGGPVMLDVFGHVIMGSTAAVMHLCLFEGATEITRLGAVAIPTASTSDIRVWSSRYRFTPSAASHTYTITGFANFTTGTQAQFGGSTAGTAAGPPAFCRFSKV